MMAPKLGVRDAADPEDADCVGEDEVAGVVAPVDDMVPVVEVVIAEAVANVAPGEVSGIVA